MSRTRRMVTLLVLLALVAIPIATQAGLCCARTQASSCCCGSTGHPCKGGGQPCGSMTAACGLDLAAPVSLPAAEAAPVAPAPAFVRLPQPAASVRVLAAPEARARSPVLEGEVDLFATLLPPPALHA